MTVEPPPLAVRTLGPCPKQVSTLPLRMNILPLLGRPGPNNLVEPSLRVQIILLTALPIGTIHTFLFVTKTVGDYGPILSIRLQQLLSILNILKNWPLPGKVPPIDGNYP